MVDDAEVPPLAPLAPTDVDVAELVEDGTAELLPAGTDVEEEETAEVDPRLPAVDTPLPGAADVPLVGAVDVSLAEDADATLAEAPDVAWEVAVSDDDLATLVPTADELLKLVPALLLAALEESTAAPLEDEEAPVPLGAVHWHQIPLLRTIVAMRNLMRGLRTPVIAPPEDVVLGWAAASRLRFKQWMVPRRAASDNTLHGPGCHPRLQRRHTRARAPSPKQELGLMGADKAHHLLQAAWGREELRSSA